MNVQVEALDDGIYRVYAPAEDEWRQRDGLAEALQTALGDGPLGGVVLDMGNVTYASSAGLAAIFGLRKLAEERGARLVLARPRRSILRLLRTANLDALIPIAESPQQAVAWLGGSTASNVG